MSNKCSLILSDGDRLEGTLVGASKVRSGEMVFSTGMVGYSEAITDPSYFGQILVFTYPLIGNYGIPTFDFDKSFVPRGFESDRAHVSAVIVSSDSDETFHWNSFEPLHDWLKKQDIPGVAGIDTRHLVHKIRSTPNLMGRVVPEVDDVKPSKYTFFNPGEHNIISRVSSAGRRVVGSGKKRIGLIDCGVKWNIIRQLLEYDCEVELLPWDTDLKTVDCSGWLISNGPGNPQNTGNLVSQISDLLKQERPVLGICLGHQLLALASGAQTKKMEYGHRGHNQPVYLAGTKRGFITSQNHGYVVDEQTLQPGWKEWFKNVNDQTNEGIYHESGKFMSVQFHPEAAGGPRDTAWILKEFTEKI